MKKFIKKYFIRNVNYLIILKLIIGCSSFAQTNIFSENMGSPSGTTLITSNIFQNNSTLTYSNGAQTSADIRSTSASTSYSGASGTGNVFFTSNGSIGFSIESINASYYSNLKLTFGYRKESPTVHANFAVDYYDGTQWVTIANTASNLFNESTSAAAGWYLSKQLTLPSAAAISGLKIRFVKSGSYSIRIDDVILSGFYNNTWIGGTNNWNNASNWSGGHIPNTSENVVISSGSPTLDINYTIPTGYNLSISGTGSLTINPNNKLTITGSADFGGNTVTVSSDATGSGAIVLNGGTLSNATNVTLKQWLTGQRAWRIFANPFTTSTDVTSNIISNNSSVSINQSSVNDILTYNNSTGVWNSSTPTSIPSNSCYAFFYKGLQTDFTGNVGGLNNYSGSGPTATTYSVNGTLNNSGVSITPIQSPGGVSALYTLVGNPFAAPVNSSALTANTANTPFYYYSTNSGSSAVTVKSGAWIAVANSSSSITIPMLGVIAYESANATSFTIPTSAINTSGTTVTSGGSNKLFKTTSNKHILEINLNRNNNMFDRFILREEGSTSNNVIDQRDLTKMTNPIASVYSITPNNEHLAVNTELSFNQAIPVGIQAPVGQYEFAVGLNTFSNSDFILIDHYLNQQQVLHNGATYNFEITSDTVTKGEHRFEISKQAWTTNVSNVSTELDVKLLSNVFTDILTLYVGNNAEQSKYYLTDARGAIISKGSLSFGEQQIDMQTLTSGMYILKIVNNNIQQVFKLIKH